MNKKALAGKPSEWLSAVASGIAAYKPDIPDSESELAIEALKVRVCDVYGVFWRQKIGKFVDDFPKLPTLANAGVNFLC